jgi:hypothetical protein
MNDQTTPALTTLSSAIGEALNTAIAATAAVRDAAEADRIAYSTALAASDTALAAANEQVSALSTQLADTKAQLDELRAANDPWFKVDKTGAIEVTAAIQKILDKAGEITIPAGTYLIDATKSLWPRSNTRINVDPEAKFKVAPNNQPAYRVWNIEGVSNVQIGGGGQYFGDRDSHTYALQYLADGKTVNAARSTHEWGIAFRVSGSHNIRLSGAKIRDFTGDGYSVGANKDHYPWVRSTQVFIDGNEVTDCRRQGISIGGVDGFEITNNLLDSIGQTNGTSPRCGMDFEPDNDMLQNDDGTIKRPGTEGGWCTNGLVEGNTVRRARTYGINVLNRVDSITFKDNSIEASNSLGIQVAGGTNITVEGGALLKNGNTGLNFASGTSGKVAGVAFERNDFDKHPTLRAKPIVQAGIVKGTANDLHVAAGATVDLTEANTYA